MNKFKQNNNLFATDMSQDPFATEPFQLKKIDIRWLIQTVLGKCMFNGMCEMRGGYYEERPNQYGQPTLAYIEDTKARFIESIRRLHDIVDCYLGSEIKKKIKEEVDDKLESSDIKDLLNRADKAAKSEQTHGYNLYRQQYYTKCLELERHRLRLICKEISQNPDLSQIGGVTLLDDKNKDSK